MKKVIICIMLLCSHFAYADHSVNPILGDKSYEKKFGTLPDAGANNTLRVLTHLQYIEQLLLKKPVSNLGSEQLCNRKKILALLHNYITAGKFPSNYDYPGQRKPCFIDKRGTICAVGYLVEQTMGRKIAEQINAGNKYNKIYEMDKATISLLTQWCAKNGMTLKECAMIQPTYGGGPDDVKRNTEVKTSYAVSSTALGAANIAINAISISHFNAGKSKWVPKAGLVLGATQVLVGVFNIKKPDYYYGLNSRIKVVYSGQNSVSYANIALGSITMVTSAYNLFWNKKVKEKKTVYGLFSYPNQDRSMTVGLSMVKKF